MNLLFVKKNQYEGKKILWRQSHAFWQLSGPSTRLSRKSAYQLSQIPGEKPEKGIAMVGKLGILFCCCPGPFPPQHIVMERDRNPIGL
jgi:hypothetical protein